MLSLYWSFIKRVFDISKKVLLVFVVFALVISLFAYFINKDKPQISPISPIEKNRAEIYKLINNKELNKTKEGKTSIAVYKAIACGTIGEACTNNPADGNKNFKNSVFGFMSNLIVMPYANPPASGVYWAYSGLQNAGFVPKAYAAEGIGFGALKPFMNLWKVFRDISYMLLVLVLVAIGFMIMFRAKINPQTVISVENALPKIVISLLLITFSFAIAGFLIDLMYVVIAIAISVMSNNNVYYDTAKFQTEYLNADFWKIIFAMFPKKTSDWALGGAGYGGLSFLGDMGNALLSFLGPGINVILRILTGIFGFWWFFFKVSGFQPITNALNGIIAAGFGLGDIPGAIIGFSAYPLFGILGAVLGAFLFPQFAVGIFILITMIFLMFRIFVLLFKTYLEILLMIIFSPILLLFEAIPGKSIFSYWIKNLVANLLTFPIVVILFIVGYIIVNTLSTPGNVLWMPPFLGGTSFDPNAFSILLGMGIVFLIPDAVKVIKELMGIKGLPISIGPGTFFAGAGAAVGGGLGTLGQFGSITLATGAIGRMMRGAKAGGGGGMWAAFLGEEPKTTKEKFEQATDKTKGPG